MTVADDLEAARASLVMINPAPYNAEAPPAALRRRRHPHRAPLRAQQLRGARPRRHPGDRRRRRRPHDPDPRRPARDAGPRPHGHPRVRRQRPPGDEAATDRRALGRLRRLHGALDRRPAPRGPGEGRAGGGRGRAPRPGRRPRARTTCRRSSPRPTRTTSPSPAPCRSAQATDPASGILIAYEMNGQPLGRDHGAPFRLIVPHWYAVASVKWLEAARRPHRAVHRRVPDRPLHLRVARPAPRAGLPDAGARPDHRPGARLDHRPRAPTPSAGRRGPGTGPITRVDVSLTGEGDWQPAQLEPPESDYGWQDWSFTWDGDRRRPTHPAGQSHRCRRQRAARRAAVEPPRLRQQRHRGHLRRPSLTPSPLVEEVASVRRSRSRRSLCDRLLRWSRRSLCDRLLRWSRRSLCDRLETTRHQTAPRTDQVTVRWPALPSKG